MQLCRREQRQACKQGQRYSKLKSRACRPDLCKPVTRMSSSSGWRCLHAQARARVAACDPCSFQLMHRTRILGKEKRPLLVCASVLLCIATSLSASLSALLALPDWLAL